jgi:hypothetical protein
MHSKTVGKYLGGQRPSVPQTAAEAAKVAAGVPGTVAQFAPFEGVNGKE